MLTVLNNLESIRTGRLQRRCTLWKLARLDGVIFRFTDHSSSITFNDEVYVPGGGFNSTARQQQVGLGSRNAELLGVLSSDAITNADLHARRFDGARINTYIVDWRYPWAGAFDTVTWILESTRFNGETWEAAVVGLSGLLQRTVGHCISRTCTHNLGQGICGQGVDLSLATLSKTVTLVVENRLAFRCDFTGETNPYVGGAIGDGYFNVGEVVWTSGNNDGLRSEVANYINSSGQVELELRTPFAIQVGDTLTISPGCLRRFQEDCKDKFDNGDNFSANPHVPGMDKMVYPI